MFLAALDQFFSRAGRCFPDLLLRVGLLFVRGVHAVARPVIAVEVFRGGALAANGTATIISALVVVAVDQVAVVVGRVLSFASRNRGRARERLAAMRASLESFDAVN